MLADGWEGAGFSVLSSWFSALSSSLIADS